MPEQFDPYYHWLGVPPHEQPPNHYRLLSLQLFEPNPEVIQHAVDRVMAQLRSFQTGQRAADSQKLLNEVTRAKICLLNPEKRKAYDARLRAEIDQAGGADWADEASPTARYRVTRGPDSGRASRRSDRPSLLRHPAALAGAGAVVLVVAVLFVRWVWPPEPSAEPGRRSVASARPAEKEHSETRGKEKPRPINGGSSEPVADTGAATGPRTTVKIPPAAQVDRLPGKGMPNHPAHPLVRHGVPSSEDPRPDSVASTTPKVIGSNSLPDPGESTKSKAAGKDSRPGSVASASSETAGISQPKLAVPSQQERLEATRVWQETHSVRIPQAKSRIAKAVLAASMLDEGRSESSAASRWVLLNQASELATNSGDIDLAFEIEEQLNLDFGTDLLERKAVILRTMLTNAKRGPYRFTLARIAFHLANSATASARYDIAAQMNSMASNAARGVGDNLLARAARSQLQRIEYARQFAARAEKSGNVLGFEPENAESHMILGQYLCLVRGDWTRGLPHLIAGNDAALAEIARQEQSNPDDSSERLAIAERWVAWARNRRPEEQTAAWRRAVRWYALAIPDLTAKPRSDAQKSLAQYDDKVLAKSWITARELPWARGAAGKLKSFSAGTSAIEAVAVATNGRSMVTGSEDGSVRRWDLVSGKEELQMAKSLKRVVSIAIGSNGRFVFGHDKEKMIAVWDSSSGQSRLPIPTPENVNCIASSPDGVFLAGALAASRKNNVLIWRVSGEKSLRVLNSPGQPERLVFSPDGRLLVTVDDRGKITGWDLASGKPALQVDGRESTAAVAFSPDGRFLAFANRQEVKIVDAYWGIVGRQFGSDGGTCLVFSADGSRLAVGDRHGSIQVWDVRPGRRLATFDTSGGAESKGSVTCMARLPDPHAILVGFSGGSAELWKLPGDANDPPRRK